MTESFEVTAVLDQWDDISDADDLFGALDDALLIADDANEPRSEVRVRVVPCIPGETIPECGRVSGMKIVRETRDGILGLGIYLFVEPS
jgi:hypothetical protein